MERKRNLLIGLFLIHFIGLFGQSNKNIYQAYITSNMGLWKSTIDSLERISHLTNAKKLDLLNYHYGYIGWCIDQNKSSEANKHVAKARHIIKQLENDKYNLSMLQAYHSALIGFEIGLSPYKAPFIGAKSQEYAEQSIAIDSANALGYEQLGHIYYYKPKLFGGSKNEAVKYYEKALKLMESKPSDLKSNWNYLNLLATIVKAYLETEQYDTAKNYSLKALHVEPEFDWIKNSLHPQILKKLSDE